MKKTILILTCLFAVVVLNGCSDSENTQTLNDWPSQEITNDTVKKVVNTALLTDDITVMIGSAPEGGEGIVIQYDIGTQSNENEAVKTIATDSVRVFKLMFKNPNVTRVIIAGKTEFTDNYGNTSKNNVATFKMNKDAASKIDWDNFKSLVYDDYNNLIKICEGYDIHPSIKAKLSQ